MTNIILDQRQPIRVICECGMEGLVMDLGTAFHWAFLEGMRHGPGCNVEVCVEVMLSVKFHSGEKPGLGIF